MSYKKQKKCTEDQWIIQGKKKLYYALRDNWKKATLGRKPVYILFLNTKDNGLAYKKYEKQLTYAQTFNHMIQLIF